MNPAERQKVIGSVANQANTTFRSNPQLMPLPDLIDPTAITLPTRECVVEIGRPILLAMIVVNAAPNSIVKPLPAWISVIREPITLIILCPINHSPLIIASIP